MKAKELAEKLLQLPDREVGLFRFGGKHLNTFGFYPAEHIELDVDTDLIGIHFNHNPTKEFKDQEKR